ncbi:hypothetical protein [Adhaeribacter aquaticus]|uniref:hypothetical protein n=1 Tax=Adhaeribacter aquaticus TaxID=299567 RepID=UPI0012FCE7FD|nr:hypothetical protein [Adhaeribacter aquaticus]
MKKSKIVLTIIFAIFLTTLSTGLFAQNQTYAYVSIGGKPFSKKLKVTVDFGDTPEQIAEGEKYSDLLTNKKSYAAVLNYLVDNQFELVETLDYTATSQGTGGTSGIVFIMRKRK